MAKCHPLEILEGAKEEDRGCGEPNRMSAPHPLQGNAEAPGPHLGAESNRRRQRPPPS